MSSPDTTGRWEMFTPQANAAVSEMMESVTGQIAVGRIDDAIRLYAEGYRKVGAVHSEIGDTAVRECLYEAIEQALVAKWGGSLDDYENIRSAFSEATY